MWRTSLESPHTGERWGFADLANLVAFLKEEMAGDTRDEVQPTDAKAHQPGK